MSGKHKKVVIAIGSVFGLLLLLLLALPLLVDADKYRPRAQAEATNALGREVNIGKLSLSIFSGGVVADELTIAEDKAFGREPFVRAKSVVIAAELLPLIFSGELRLQSLTLVEPVVQLKRDRNEKWNFASLGAKAAGASSGKTSAAPAVSIAHLKIEDGKLVMTQDGRTATYENVQVTVRNLSLASSFPFEVSVQSPGGGTLELSGRAGPMHPGDATRTPFNASVAAKGFDLGQTGFMPASAGFGGKLDLEGDAESDGKNLESAGTLTIEKLKASRNGAPSSVPVALQYATKMDLESKRGTIEKGDIKIGSSHAALTGTFDARGASPALQARLKAEEMAVDQLSGLLPAFGVVLPSGSALRGGTASADLQLNGPADRLVVSGPINLSGSRVQGFNLKSRASAIAALAGVSSGSDLLIQLLDSRVRVAPEGIRLDGIRLVAPGIGTVSGSGIIGSNNSLNFKLRAKLEGGGGVSSLAALGQPGGEVPFLVQGTTSNPVFLPDVAGALSGAVKAPAQGAEKILGIFGRKKN